MIGVIADTVEENVVREFFELFKTPWEFYRAGRHYEVLLCTQDRHFDGTAGLVIFYAGRKLRCDDEQDILIGRRRSGSCVLSYQGSRIPIYGDSVTFPEKGADFLTEENSQRCAAYLDHSRETALARIGYDLFGEVRKLLIEGQPPANAGMPALELHIVILRDLITACGVRLVEIPSVPEGYRFIACLTHDVDHPSIRQHGWDHTTLGFLYRAVFGSLLNLIRGRIPLKDLLTNWAAALKLPLVHLGVAKDFWRDFDGRYIELEKSPSSTFFVIPFKKYAGARAFGWAARSRGAGYGAQDIADKIQKLIAAGCEIGVHGIDAWLDSSKGRQEFDEIRRLSGASELGVRMHWLYYDQQSPAALEKAGAAYDSTIGYTETVGYRAGTTQAYKPLQVSRLLELPLHVMDTALFYPSYLGLSRWQARTLLDRMMDNAVQFGGCLTINWHDRSTAPERLWETCYRDLVQDLTTRGAWFSTAGQAVSWFRKRRAAVFETDFTELGGVCAKLTSDHPDNLPRLRLRIHNARDSRQIGAHGSEGYVDIPFDEGVDTRVGCETDE